MNDIEKEDELNTEGLPIDETCKWKLLRNQITHNPLEMQEEDEYIQEYSNDLEEIYMRARQQRHDY